LQVYTGYLRKNLEVNTSSVFTYLKLSLEFLQVYTGDLPTVYGTEVLIFW